MPSESFLENVIICHIIFLNKVDVKIDNTEYRAVFRGNPLEVAQEMERSPSSRTTALNVSQSYIRGLDNKYLISHSFSLLQLPGNFTGVSQ